jgi:hypothetical protein
MSEELPVSVLKLATTYAAALAAVGYISLRAYMNYLGVDMLSLTTEVLLMETYTIAFHTLIHLLLIGGAAFVLYLLYLLVTHRAANTSRAGRLKALLAQPWCAAIVVALLIVAALTLLTMAGRNTDVIVGSLRKERLVSPPIWPFDAALLISMAGIGMLPLMRKAQLPPSSRRLWRFSVLPWLTIGVLTPVLYGSGVRPAIFPMCEASFKTAGASPISGFLIDATSERVLIWHAEHGIGKITSAAAEDISALTIRESGNIVDAARLAAR